MKFNPLKKINDAKNNISAAADTAKNIGNNSESISQITDKSLNLVEMLTKFLSNDCDTQELQNLKQGSAGQILHNPELHDNINNLLTDFRKLINNINDNPEKYNINITVDKKMVDTVENLASTTQT